MVKRVVSLVSLLGVIAILSGCASSQIKARKEAREKAAQNSRIWCEFVNGEVFPDVDVAVNIEMSKRCDADKNYSVTAYRTPSENQGVIYCCTLRGEANAPAASPAPKAENKKESPATPEGN